MLDSEITDEELTEILGPTLGYQMRRWPRETRRTIAKLAHEFGLEQKQVLAKLRLGTQPDWMERLVSSATITHTKFFRHRFQLEKLAQAIFARWRSQCRPIHVWVAGCSSGEEAYSIALLTSPKVELRIFASDINRQAIDEAKDGRYARGPTGKPWAATPNLRRRINFEQASLVGPQPSPPNLRFDFIVCRNVLIYFGSVNAKKLFLCFRSRVREDGALIVSPADSLVRRESAFTPTETLGWLQVAKAVPPALSRGRVTTVPEIRTSDVLNARAMRSPGEAQAEQRSELEAGALALSAGSFEEAEHCFRAHLDVHKSDSRAWFLLGEALRSRGESSQALAAFSWVQEESDSALQQAAARRIRSLIRVRRR